MIVFRSQYLLYAPYSADIQSRKNISQTIERRLNSSGFSCRYEQAAPSHILHRPVKGRFFFGFLRIFTVR